MFRQHVDDEYITQGQVSFSEITTTFSFLLTFKGCEEFKKETEILLDSTVYNYSSSPSTVAKQDEETTEKARGSILISYKFDQII